MKLSLLVSVCIIGGLSLFFWWYATAWQFPNDRLNSAYKESHQPSWWSADPYSSDIEADDMFNSNLPSDSVFVRFARWLMRVWVMISIPLLIFMGIKIMFSLWDQAKLKKSLTELWYVLLWIIILLASVVIVFLIASITRWNLQNFVPS